MQCATRSALRTHLRTPPERESLHQVAGGSRDFLLLFLVDGGGGAVVVGIDIAEERERETERERRER